MPAQNCYYMVVELQGHFLSDQFAFVQGSRFECVAEDMIDSFEAVRESNSEPVGPRVYRRQYSA